MWFLNHLYNKIDYIKIFKIYIYLYYMFNYNKLNANFRGVNQITTCKKIPIINGLEDTENH